MIRRGGTYLESKEYFSLEVTEIDQLDLGKRLSAYAAECK